LSKKIKYETNINNLPTDDQINFDETKVPIWINIIAVKKERDGKKSKLEQKAQQVQESKGSGSS